MAVDAADLRCAAHRRLHCGAGDSAACAPTAAATTEGKDYVPPQGPVQPRRAPNQDPYDYREEISRVATGIPVRRSLRRTDARRSRPSRPAAPTPRQVPDFDEDDETPTVYKSRPSSEPSTKRND